MTLSITIRNIITTSQGIIDIYNEYFLLLQSLITYLSQENYTNAIQTAQSALALLNNTDTLFDNILIQNNLLLEKVPPHTSAIIPQMREALIFLEVCLEEDGVSIGNGWDKDDRIREAYTAVDMIITRLSQDFPVRFPGPNSNPTEDEKRHNGIFYFNNTFRGTRLKLVAGQLAGNPQAAASTALVDRDGDGVHETSVIEMYTAPFDANNQPIPNFVHSAPNIVHEFGHIVVDLTGTTNDKIYDDWEQIRVNFRQSDQSVRDGILVPTGWLNAQDFRQNQQTGSELCPTAPNAICQSLEVERIADMFLYWVYKNNPDYAFDTNNANAFIKDVAIAFQNFTNVQPLSWQRSNGIQLTSKGMLHWFDTIIDDVFLPIIPCESNPT